MEFPCDRLFCSVLSHVVILFSYFSLNTASGHSQIKNAVIYACLFIFSEMNLNRGTANDNFQKKVDALTEEGMA